VAKSGVISDKLNKFIECSVRSVGHLEAILFFAENRERAFTASEVSRALRTSTTSARRQIEDLILSGVLVLRVSGELKVQYAPQDSATDDYVVMLATLYKERKTTVIDAIYSRPIDKIRSFADAFKIDKE
jgi:DNA-binding transcriptional regulator GbsR (MarR family)